LTGPDAKIVTCPRIDPQGAIRLPFLPRVALLPGNLPTAEQRIAKAYSDGQFGGPIEVTVELDEIGRQVAVQSAPLQPGDALQLHVWDLHAAGAETVVDCIVAANGSITPPQLPPVAVQGLSEAAAEVLLSQAYATQKIMQNARVTVERIPHPAAGERGL
jgi:protein involved in polysaccharide export with SLBB domain